MSPLMLIHVVSGTIAVFAGAGALAAPKGRRFHRWAGNTFFVSMFVSAAVGGYIAVFTPEMITALAGAFTCYLVVTSWMTATSETARPGLVTGLAALSAAAIAAGGILFGFEAMRAPTGLKDGFTAEPYFVFGGLSLLAAGLDVSVLIRKGVTGAQRIARHLWRMCLALFIAVGSLFTGPGATAFPDWLQGSPLLSAPELIVFVLMWFWLVRVLFFRAR